MVPDLKKTLSMMHTALPLIAPFYILKPLSLLINFVTISMLTHMIGVDGYGVISLLLATSAFLATFLDFRSNEALVKFRVSYLSEGDYASANFCLLLGIAIDAVIALCYFTIVFIFTDFICINLLHSKVEASTLLIYAASSSFLFLAATPAAVLQCEKLFWSLNFADFLRNGSRLIFVWLLISPISLHYIVVGYAAANVLYGLILIGFALHAIRKDDQKFNVRPSKNIARSFLSFSTKTFLSSLLKVGINDFDKLVIGYFGHTQDVGLYDIVKRIAGLLLWITFPFGTIAYPSLVKLFHQKKYQSIRDFINRVTLITLGISSIAAISIFLAKGVILQFFNLGPISILGLLIPLLLSNILQNSLWFSRVFVNSIGKPQISIWMGGIMSIATIIMLLLLVPAAGVTGAAIANAGAMTIIFLFWMIYYLKVTRKWSTYDDQ